MIEHRHPNPIIDVRRPRRHAVVGSSPPAFVWRPVDGAVSYVLRYGRSSFLLPDDPATVEEPVDGPFGCHVPDAALGAGRWWWTFSALARDGRVVGDGELFDFDVADDAVDLSPGPAGDLHDRIPTSHPRLLVTADDLDDLRRRLATTDDRAWLELVAAAESYLDTAPMPEPPPLPDRGADPDGWADAWGPLLWETRTHGHRLEVLAAAALGTGDRRFEDTAVDLLVHWATWDPDGPTSLAHNDEAHMAIMNHAFRAYDWLLGAGPVLADRSDDAAAVRAALTRRAEITWDRLVATNYGVTGTDSHTGRMLPSLTEAAVALAHEAPAASDWLDRCARLLVGWYPAWGGEDGGWAEGVNYATAYVRRALHAVAGLRSATGLDLSAKPFFRNHGDWRRLCTPPYASRFPFGDGADALDQIAPGTAVVMEHLGRVHGRADWRVHAETMRSRAVPDGVDSDRSMVSALVALDTHRFSGRVATATVDPRPEGGAGPATVARHFADIGWVAVRTAPDDPGRDLFVLFKSSPYGAVSHQHADQNCFVLSAGGEELLVSTGAYDVWDGPHHHGWTRQTKAGNGVLVDGVGQLARSAAGGRITEFAVDGDTVTMAGDATDAYGGRATRAIRRITVTGDHTVTIEDDLEAPTPSTFDVLLHAPPTATVEVDGDALVVRGRRAWLRARVVEPSPMLLWTSGTVDVPPPAWLPQPADIHATFRTRVPTHRQRIVTVLAVHLPHRSG